MFINILLTFKKPQYENHSQNYVVCGWLLSGHRAHCFLLILLTLVSKKEETDTGLFYATVGWVVGAIHFGALYCITSACVLYIEKQTKDSKK